MFVKLWTGFFFSCFFLSLFLATEGCQYHLGDNSTIELPSRRRRQASTQYEQHVIRTTGLRGFFTACLSVMVTDATYDWRSNVDFSVLDTVWFLNNADINCGFGTGRAGCWKDNLITYLNVQSDLVESVRTCINQYAEDYSFNPPRNRYAQNVAQSRKKRGFTEDPRAEYSFCLDDRTQFELRQSLNFQQLSRFIEEETTTETCYSTNTQNTRRADWPSRFVVLTRTDSPVRDPLEDCGRMFFPEDFPSTEVYDDPIQWDTWNIWTPCSASCGSGRRYRDRGCSISSLFGAAINGQFCECYFRNSGPAMEDEICNSQICVFDNWGEWAQWSSCSVTCGQGSRTRYRTCLGSGDAVTNRCPGPNSQAEPCTQSSCFFTPPPTRPPLPTPIAYSSWTLWGNCQVTCQGPGNLAIQTRFRCPLNQSCRIPNRQTRPCLQIRPCQFRPQ